MCLVLTYIRKERNSAEVNKIIEIKHLCKSFGDIKAVDDLSFGVKEGELFAFLGVNGAGKSTTINIMCGQLSKDSRTITINNTDLDKNVDIPKASLRTAFFDTCAAMVAALAIMPAVFAYGIGAGRGPALVFLALPKVFQQMPLGQFFAIIFFVAVLFAGITSLINMLEAVAESWEKNFNLNRKVAVLASCAIALGVGVFIEAEPKVGAWMDFVSIIISPLGAVLGAISVYYVLGWDDIRKEMEQGHGKLSEAFGAAAKYLYVPLTIIIMVLGLIYGGI